MNAKQIFTTLAAFALLMASGCNAQNKQENTNTITQSNNNTMNKIVIFFSHAGDNYSVGNIEVGNTKIVADYIQEGSRRRRAAALRGTSPRPLEVRHRLHRRPRVVGHLPAGDVHALQGHRPRGQDRHPLHHPRGQRPGQLRQRREESLPQGQRHQRLFHLRPRSPLRQSQSGKVAERVVMLGC